MKKFLFISLFVFTASILFAQQSTSTSMLEKLGEYVASEKLVQVGVYTDRGNAIYRTKNWDITLLDDALMLVKKSDGSIRMHNLINLLYIDINSKDDQVKVDIYFSKKDCN